MWTVTLDSNIPIVTTSNSDSSLVHGSCSSRTYITSRDDGQDVTDLLGSSSPRRSRSPNLKGHPPRSPRRTKVGSRSASPLPRRPQSPSLKDTSYDWKRDTTTTLTPCELSDDLGKYLSSDLDGSGSVMLHRHHYDRGGPMKASYDNRPIVSFPDSDSGFDSMKQRSLGLTNDDINSSLSARLTRSQSMSRLNGSFAGDSSSLSGSQGTTLVSSYKERSLRELNEALDDSVSRRSVLVHKLKEAQSTLELQSDRLNKIEASSKDNNMLVEDLRFKEREYRKKISHLEAVEDEKQRLQMENLRLREQMQERVSALDYQLKSLKTQHKTAESENSKRISQLDSTTTALTFMEEENCRLQKDREKLQSDVMMLKEVLALTQNRFGALDTENRNIKNNTVRLKEDNTALTHKVQEMAGQMIELRSLLKAVKDENEQLSSTWKSSAEDKTRSVKQLENYQDTITDLKARLAATSADRDRLFQEKLQNNSKIQQMVLDKEQMMKTKLNLEDQLNERMSLNASVKSFDYHYHYEPDVKEQLKELESVKKVSEELSSELASVKAFYERSLEQIASLERNKSMLQSQQELGDQERRRLHSEVERLSLVLNNQSHDGRKEQDYQEEMIHKLRNEIKQMRYEKNALENKNQELETKLMKANEGLREGTALQHSELDTWKQTCERLTTSVSWKESELRNLTDRNHELEETALGLRLEVRALKDKCEMTSDKEDEINRCYEENRRLIQEKAENEQMIKLLETQKEVLSKNSEGSISKVNEIESLSVQMDQIRNENQTFRKKIIDLEQERDDIIFQKDELIASSDSMYKNPSLADLESKMEELRDANKQLREMNEAQSNQIEVLTKESPKSSSESGTLKQESDQMKEENLKLKADFNNLKHEYGLLDAKHQRFIINYGHDGEIAAKEKQDMIQLRKEKDAIQKQVTLLQGQISLMEGSKKRADDQITKMTGELADVSAQVKQNSSIQSFNNSKDSDSDALRKEVETLKKQLESAKQTQKMQDKMMERLREESLEDVGVELHQMRDELQQLMKEIQTKEQTIENLGSELRTERRQHEEMIQEIKRYRKAVTEMEAENQELRQNVLEIRDVMAAELDKDQQDESLKRSKSEKSLQEELAEALKAKQQRVLTKSQPSSSSAFLSKSMTELRPASAPPMSNEPDPPKAATEGSDRLQSLISKYRSHGNKDGSSSDSQVKPLPGFAASKIVSKSRFGVGSPKAPMRRSTGDETPVSPLAKEDNDTTNVVVRKAKKLPPPPPLPKPTASSKSSFMRSLSDSAGKDEQKAPTSSLSLSVTSPLLQSKATTPAKPTTPIGSQSQGFLSSSKTSPSSFSASASGSAASLSSSGIGTASSAEALGDSQEQKDINALIQKEMHDRYLKVLEST